LVGLTYRLSVSGKPVFKPAKSEILATWLAPRQNNRLPVFGDRTINPKNLDILPANGKLSQLNRVLNPASRQICWLPAENPAKTWPFFKKIVNREYWRSC